MELQSLGVHIEGRDERRLYSTGPPPAGPRRAVITCPKAIRQAVALLIGMRAVLGASMLKSVVVIGRGYDYEPRFNVLGAISIKKEKRKKKNSTLKDQGPQGYMS